MTIFSKIIQGEIPAYKIAENELFFAFLDIFPLQKGPEVGNRKELPRVKLVSGVS